MTTRRKVPELSLLSYLHGSKEDKQNFIDDLYIGLKDYGFIILKDHDIDQKLVDKAYALGKDFFSLPQEVKNQYIMNNSGQRAYTPNKTEHAKNNKNPDLKEFWHVGRELTKKSPYYDAYPKNMWVKEIKDFRQTYLELYKALDKVAIALLDALSPSLGLDKKYFREMVKDGNSIVRVIHYPPTKGENTTKSIRAAAHEDINLITLLLGATASGLQLLERDGTWLDVESRPGEIVVDTGDMISRITNNVLPSTTHRVINPDNDTSERFSMPFFVHPHNEAMLACIPSCEGDKKLYPNITAHDFLQQRLKEIGLNKKISF